MKKQQFALIGIMLVMLTVLSLSGCMDEKSKFNGTWKTAGGETTFTFAGDTVTISGTGPLGLTGSLDYAVADNKITFSPGGSLGITMNYRFSDSTLILSTDSGESLILTKV